jgi:branched-chain amino acid transport system substrate-binding protein
MRVVAALMLLCLGTVSPGLAEKREPIKIGYGISLTGGSAPNGKSALLAHKIWEEDVNAHGGLLGRPVKLVYYDDKSDADTVRELYPKLLDDDRVDLIIGGYGTNMVASAMRVAIEKQKLLIGLFGVTVNSDFHYPNYFAMSPLGSSPWPTFTQGFFSVAMAQSPKPQTVAVLAIDNGFGARACDGAREHAEAAKLKIVYDEKYPTETTGFAPIVRAIGATSPDLLVICSSTADSIGIVRAVNEVGLKSKMIGGAMAGLQATVIKTQMGPLLNGFVNYDFWLPVPTMNSPIATDFMKKYQATAPSVDADPLGYYAASWGYAQLELLGEAVSATKSLNDAMLADYFRVSTFKTIVGEVKFAKDGEWAQSRVLQVQFQHIKGNDVAQFKDISTQVVVAPAEYASGNLIYPYERAR